MWWYYEMFSALMDIVEGNPLLSPDKWQRANNDVSFCQPEQSFEPTIELYVVWDTTMLMWRRCNDACIFLVSYPCSLYHMTCQIDVDIFSHIFQGCFTDTEIVQYFSKMSGVRLTSKMSSYQPRDHIIQIRRSHHSLIIQWEFLYLERK